VMSRDIVPTCLKTSFHLLALTLIVPGGVESELS
jgi:hypothetical protein